MEKINKIIYVDMDDVLCDFMGSYSNMKRLNPDIKYPQSQFDFFRNLEPIKNGVMSVYFLSKFFDLYFLTAPSEYNPFSYTEKRMWIQDHFGLSYVNRLIISPHKHLNIGDYLIDDQVNGKGQDKFTGKLINFGSDEFPDWNKITKYFSEKYKLEIK